jgi:hypothetical protein
MEEPRRMRRRSTRPAERAAVWNAIGNGRERDAALVMLEQIPGTKQVTVGGDKAYDTVNRALRKRRRRSRQTPYKCVK